MCRSPGLAELKGLARGGDADFKVLWERTSRGKAVNGSPHVTCREGADISQQLQAR